MTAEVYLSKRAEKHLAKIPDHVARKFLAWVDAVEDLGLAEVRKVPGYHDEPLKGDRKGQRSIRLSRAYRAIYEVEEQGEVVTVDIVTVEEITKHEY